MGTIPTELQVPGGGDKRTRQCWSRLSKSVGLITGHVPMCVLQWPLYVNMIRCDDDSKFVSIIF